ncbi:CoA ester lyase [Altererythrobacter marinus]|uniref:CoA ester lyase n=1 Tax=Pelagerythrobacter marinus TaxID=538382 RepID=A0ABW9V179_9SPHN|nr:CoA ester lyase [Pelagerythrobacter marinus]MXO69467.1 CoA ester lyase [Pelagerythrobacter marinus]
MNRTGAPLPAAPSTLRAQSLLFVPGSRPDRIAKALDSGADLVCVDLEDSVPEDGKGPARAAALAAIADHADGRLALRINGIGTRHGLADLLAVAEAEAPPPLLLLPKVESDAEVALIASALGRDGIGLVPLVENPRGLRAAHRIAAAPQVCAMMFGGGDLSGELGVALEWEPLIGARSQFILACAEAGVPAIDVPYVRLGDEAGLEEETRRAKALGFAAKAAIHPDQIATIHRMMRPTAEELEEAQAAEAAFAAGNGAAVRFRGKMLEAPIMRRYRQILAYKD